MNRVRLIAIAGMMLMAATVWAQANQPGSIGKVLDNQLSSVEREFVPAAEAMPDAKFNFAPTSGEFKGVRTFAQQVKHVAATNFMFYAAIAGEKPPLDLGKGENGPDTITSKADIVKFLKDSFAYGHKVLSSQSENKWLEQIKSPFGQGTMRPLGLAVLTHGHMFDHYGQMVEYLRMNGIVPPASRPQPQSGM